MRVPTRTRYGVKAMYELAAAGSDTPLSARDISERQHLSEHYLEQLLAPLRKAGLVQSIRGAQGGYLLGRAPERITIAQIVEVLDGAGGAGDCIATVGVKVERCPDPVHCVDHWVWHRLADAVNEVLGSITLADLLRQAERGQVAPMYYI